MLDVGFERSIAIEGRQSRRSERMLKFSIITCTWNSEPYIGQCIDSVRAQSYSAVEHVFVDGGSEDGTLQRIQALGQSVQWTTGIRGGISNAMNVGAAMASGEIIAHLHGDDYYLSNSVLADVAEAFLRTDAKWVFGRIASDIDGALISPTWKMPRFSRERLLRGNFIAHPALFIRRDFFNSLGGFDQGLKYAMDYDLWLRAAAVSEPIYIEKELAAFRRHEGSTSTANAEAAFVEDHSVRLRYLEGSSSARILHESIHLWRRMKRRFR